jgi:hypothetical protein
MNTPAGADIFPQSYFLHGTVHSHLVWMAFICIYLSCLVWQGSKLILAWKYAGNELIFGLVRHGSMFFFAWFVSILSSFLSDSMLTMNSFWFG